MSGKDVKQSTVDSMTKRIVDTTGTSVEKARQIARESAERVNRQRRGAK